MSLLDELRKKLDSESFAKVTDALGDDFNYDLISRQRLNKVIAQRNEAREELAKLAQSNASPANNEDEDDDANSSTPNNSKSSNGTGLTQEDLEKAVLAERKAGEVKLLELQLRFAVTAKLQEAKFTDPDLVLKAGLIDLDKVKLDSNGTITGGLDDQISAIAQAKPFLVSASDSASTGTGKAGGSGGFGSVTSLEEFLKLDTDKQIEFKQANPETFKGFMGQI